MAKIKFNAATRAKAIRNRKRRLQYKKNHVQQPTYLNRVNSFVLILKYADSLRSAYRNDNYAFLRRKMVPYGSPYVYCVRSKRIRKRRKSCLGFVVHRLSPSFSSTKNARVVDIQGYQYANDIGLTLPLPDKKLQKLLIRAMKRFWYSLTTNFTTKGLWIHEGGKHGVYYQLFRRGNYWKVAMRLAWRFLGKKSPTNLLKLLWKGRYRMNGVYNCNKFVRFVSKALGKKVKITFQKIKGSHIWYLDEIHILFDMNLKMIDYVVAKTQRKYNSNSAFLLESCLSR